MNILQQLRVKNGVNTVLTVKVGTFPIRAANDWVGTHIRFASVTCLPIFFAEVVKRIFATNQLWRERGGIDRALFFALAARDRVSAVHCQNVSGYVQRLAEVWGLEEEERRWFWQAGLLHDIGKIGVSDRVLKSSEKYISADWEEMKQHVRIGAVLLKSLGFAEEVVRGALYHHERYDGRGYLTGLAGENIPLVARMIAVADTFDALTSYRRYRKPAEPGRALEIMAASSGKFDPQVLQCFLSLWAVRPIA